MNKAKLEYRYRCSKCLVSAGWCWPGARGCVGFGYAYHHWTSDWPGTGYCTIITGDQADYTLHTHIMHSDHQSGHKFLYKYHWTMIITGESTEKKTVMKMPCCDKQQRDQATGSITKQDTCNLLTNRCLMCTNHTLQDRHQAYTYDFKCHRMRHISWCSLWKLLDTSNRQQQRNSTRKLFFLSILWARRGKINKPASLML